MSAGQEQPDTSPPELIRGIGLAEATSLNMIDMIGVGPFITLPLIIASMGGPQAMLGWILGAFFALCDGLIWAELGAALPGSGGTYGYLRRIYGRNTWGRLLSFLFIWQLSFSAPLSIASGAVGLSGYASFLWPGFTHIYSSHDWSLHLPLLGDLKLRWSASNATFLSIATIVSAAFLLARRITSVGSITKWLWLGVTATIVWIIIAGLTHFNTSQAFDFPPGAFSGSHNFFLGLGSAMLIATYDYWGYYNVSFLGDEVREPGRTIPRALLLSILLVACLYVVMNVSVLGTIPWREMQSGNNSYIMASFMQRIYGQWAAVTVTVLIMWAAFASIFSLLLGYSRVPYAAALDRNYFRAFAYLHPTGRYPEVSLFALAGVALLCCFLSLADLIAALVVVRIVLQFVVQAVGLIVFRIREPLAPRPFRMWLFPLPALAAIAGFLFVLFSRHNYQRELRYAIVVLATGLMVFLLRSLRYKQWPFAGAAASNRHV